MWRDVSGTVGGGGSNGRWTVVSSDKYESISKDRQKAEKKTKTKMTAGPPTTVSQTENISEANSNDMDDNLDQLEYT